MRYFVVPFWLEIMLLVVCLPQQWNEYYHSATTETKKVVWGKHNVLVHYVDASAPNPSGVIFCNPFKWDIVLFISDPKSCFFSVSSTPAKWILFLNHRNKKVVGGEHNGLVHYVDVSAPNPAGVVLWNPLKWDILWFISDQKSCFLNVQ